MGTSLKVLLDSCSLIWLGAEPKRLSKTVASTLRDSGTEIFISQITVWEIHLKCSKGKLEFPTPFRYWLNQQMEHWRLDLLPIDIESIHRSSELPEIHADPFDRLLVAQAMHHQMPIATPDPWIRRYPVEILW